MIKPIIPDFYCVIHRRKASTADYPIASPAMTPVIAIRMVAVRTSPRLPSLLRPLEIVAHIFGVAIIALPQRKSLFYLSCAYTTMQLALSSGLSLYRIGNIQPKFCQQNAVSHSVNGIQQLLGLTVVIASYYQTLFRKSDVRQILKLLARSHHDLLQLNVILRHRVFGIKVIGETVLVLVYAYAAFIVFAIHYGVTSIDALALEYFSTINPLVLANLALLMFNNFCWSIRNELQRLRQMLEEMVNCEQQDGKDSSRIWIVGPCKESPTLQLYRIQQIAKIYETLFDATQALNRIFGLSNLTSIGE